MFARSAMSERTATLSPRWTASANRESAAKTGTPSITDKATIRSAFSLIRAPPRQSQVTDETGFRGIASRLHAAVKRGGCDIFFQNRLPPGGRRPRRESAVRLDRADGQTVHESEFAVLDTKEMRVATAAPQDCRLAVRQDIHPRPPSAPRGCSSPARNREQRERAGKES